MKAHQSRGEKSCKAEDEFCGSTTDNIRMNTVQFLNYFGWVSSIGNQRRRYRNTLLLIVLEVKNRLS